MIKRYRRFRADPEWGDALFVAMAFFALWVLGEALGTWSALGL